jgi:cytosine/adenosine deaminase-related metal-dependent hydrolase
VGLFTGLLTLPFAPVRGVIWLGERLLDQAYRELSDPEAIYQRLEEIEEARASGVLSAQDSADAEAELVARLMRAYGRGGPAQT